MTPPPIALDILLVCLGLIAGSFLGMLAMRLPTGQPIFLARSACDSCQRKLAPWQLVPIASWLIQQGQCRICRGRISFFYPAMEAAAAGIALWASCEVSGIALIFSLGLGWSLLALAAMDILTFRLSDFITLPLVVAGVAAGWILGPDHLFDNIAGALAGWAALALVGALYRILRHRQGLGQGDAKLLAAGGAWLGWQGLASVLLIATVTALLAVLSLRLAGHKIGAETKLAFGAFLALGIWIVWLYGPLSI